ncbi:hypothetical protein J2Q11_08605 [Tenacibaculum finnmarkense genomovar finnmarkense]|uniref:hypothetical protein n=1 Tax=Tenacibaculum finnmarkense TaxID=2781243 RepID=UPI001EFB7201|nr:hypothetical protein [Tenacibaculum finnmarkense]MCG8212943.1 hypothetical protein [Tenacibaculum finnmarkense genomovar finnmarkense]MCG8231186.1 hypothetical protein [Tenacibaculum finnmarkense genomovar finnmarkense]MCG8884599.1 hypothetical protein [Tenacibaculum finnmarkense]MCG8897179.1 hypothetical protein [Tenacibaculum finnmarkense]MCG8903214.1 hypothetical protein [Tenacibaculum finnmarkense]
MVKQREDYYEPLKWWNGLMIDKRKELSENYKVINLEEIEQLHKTQTLANKG